MFGCYCGVIDWWTGCCVWILAEWCAIDNDVILGQVFRNRCSGANHFACYMQGLQTILDGPCSTSCADYKCVLIIAHVRTNTFGETDKIRIIAFTVFNDINSSNLFGNRVYLIEIRDYSTLKRYRDVISIEA